MKESVGGRRIDATRIEDDITEAKLANQKPVESTTVDRPHPTRLTFSRNLCVAIDTCDRINVRGRARV